MEKKGAKPFEELTGVRELIRGRNECVASNDIGFGIT